MGEGACRDSGISVLNLGTLKVLIAWAKWGECVYLGYPSLSPMFGERCLKSPLFGLGYTPNDIMLMEQAVCFLTFQERELIIQRWQRKRTFRQIGEHVGCDHTTAMRRLHRAENDLGQLFAMLHQEAHVVG